MSEDIRTELRESLKKSIEALTKIGEQKPVDWLLFLCNALDIKASDLTDLAYNNIFDPKKYIDLENFYLDHIRN